MLKKYILAIVLVLLAVLIFTSCSSKDTEANTELIEELSSSPSKSLYVKDKKTKKELYDLDLSYKLYEGSIMLEWNSDDAHKNFYIYLYNKSSDEYIYQTSTKSNRITIKQLQNALGEPMPLVNGETYDIQIFCEKNRTTELGNNTIKVNYFNLIDTPKLVTAQQIDGYKVKVTWEAVPDAVKYVVYASDEYRGYYAEQGTTSELEFIVPEITNNKGITTPFEEGYRYSFFVISEFADGTRSSLSTAQSFSVLIHLEGNEETEYQYTETYPIDQPMPDPNPLPITEATINPFPGHNLLN